VTGLEFSRPVRIDTLGTVSRPMQIEADEAERAALARRFDLQAIAQLSAEAELARFGEIVRASGTLAAKVTQSCVATGAAVEAEVAEQFSIEFRPQPAAGGADEEIELSEGELDIVFYEGASVDLGDAVAESLSLALDPYPRCSDADLALAQAGVIKEGEEPPRGALAGLKDLLRGANPPRHEEGDRDA
jgi:uncharacterized metal-binding protein YceD (DUF177 family)